LFHRGGGAPGGRALHGAERAGRGAADQARAAVHDTVLEDSQYIPLAGPAPHQQRRRLGEQAADGPALPDQAVLCDSAGVPHSIKGNSSIDEDYGFYLADGGSDLYVTGEPSAAWDPATFSEVQSVGSGVIEAVDVTPIFARAGFDASSAAVPP